MHCKLLIIDDSPLVHRVLKFQLRRGGFELKHAYDGASGIEAVHTFQPDVILLDMMMPDITGIEVCQILKNDERSRPIPVIFLTGETETKMKVRALDVGGVDYVTKPFIPAELKARIRAAHRMKRLVDLLARRAQIDALTGLWNRAHFDERLSEEVDAASRYERHFTLVMVDIDHFKRCNDTYGHQFGDHVLERVGHVLHECTRQSDIAFRYGGEEFAILLRETTAQDARVAVERYQTQIRAMEFNHAHTQVRITASFGIADSLTCPLPFSAASVIGLADSALYQAKANGRNCYVISAPPENPIRSVTPALATGH